MSRFRTILCDPPWTFKMRGRDTGGRSAASHYLTQHRDWIRSLPVAEVAADDCALLLWSTNPHLPEALDAIQAWGFTYSTKLTWVKMARAGAPRLGLGWRARACTEDLLICTRGTVAAPPTDARLAA